MKSKFMTKLLATVMAAAVVVTAVPATAMAAPVYNKSQVLYMTNTSGESDGYIHVTNLKKSQTIDKSSVKSDNTSVAKPYYLTRNTNSYKTEYFYKNWEPFSNSGYSYDICLKLAKTGTANISFKIKGISAKQSVKVKVKPYVNPVKSLKISGISADLKSKTKASAYVSNIKMTKTTAKAAVKVSAAKGWKVSRVQLYDATKGKYTSIESYSKPVSEDTLYVGKLTKNKPYSVWISFVNTSDNSSLYCNYYINRD